jgi:FtsP/CotA-like multicopper oxidase with cupredoxin domain
VQGVLLALVFVLGMSGGAGAAEYWLRAEVAAKTMPDTSVVTMWGFAQCTDGTYATCTAATVPGPALVVPPADTTLTIHLRNDLTGPFVESVSIIIPGQTAALSPVKFTDATGRQRVKSFTTETPPDGTTVVDYLWNSLKAGTYLYQSGSHPAVQVQMGLYGAMSKDAATGQAYGPSTAYTAEAVLLFSEIARPSCM